MGSEFSGKSGHITERHKSLIFAFGGSYWHHIFLRVLCKNDILIKSDHVLGERNLSCTLGEAASINIIVKMVNCSYAPHMSVFFVQFYL